MQVPKFSCSLGAEFHCPLRQHPPLQSHTRVFLQFPHHQEQVGLPVTQATLATSLEGREGSAAALGKVAGLIPSVYFSFSRPPTHLRAHFWKQHPKSLPKGTKETSLCTVKNALMVPVQHLK